MSSSSPKIRWPLAVSTFTLWDKLKIAGWLIGQDRYTMGAKVEEFERQMTEFAGAHALMVSSGSTANQLVFELWKVKNPGKTAIVHCPAVTWISSITPATMAGFQIEFCDVNVKDLSFDYEMLERNLKKNRKQRQIIWPTALIGHVPDMDRLKKLAVAYKAELFLDSCENTFSPGILASCDMTTTSCYLSHQIVSVEGGFVFFKDFEDWKLAKMFRNHGMTRSLPPDDPVRRYAERANSGIDPSFLFALPGTNLRPSDVHAMFGLQDMKRLDSSRQHRRDVYEYFANSLNSQLYYLPPLTESVVGFCLPIFRKDGKVAEVKKALKDAGVETRPIIGGNLLHQPPFKSLGDPKDFPNAEWIHTHGCYVGLHADVTMTDIDDLVEILDGV